MALELERMGLKSGLRDHPFLNRLTASLRSEMVLNISVRTRSVQVRLLHHILERILRPLTRWPALLRRIRKPASSKHVRTVVVGRLMAKGRTGTDRVNVVRRSVALVLTHGSVIVNGRSVER